MTVSNQDTLARNLRIALVHRSGSEDWTWLLGRCRYADQLDVRSVRIPPFAADRGIGQVPASMMAAERVWSEHQSEPFDLILSHLPGCAAWIELMRRGRKGRHDLFAFNFTTIPTGPRRWQMNGAFRRLHQSFTLTEVERHLYAESFGMDPSRITVVPWGVTPPTVGAERLIDGSYIASLGGEARDYAPLIEAAAQLPDEKFVIVARPQNLAGLALPANVTTMVNIPGPDAWNIVDNADMHILSLQNSETPCGIVTVVGAMHLGKPQIMTAAPGVLEYAPEGEASIGVPGGSAEAIVQAIQQLRSHPEQAARMGAAARTRAAERFSEEMTKNFVDSYLRTIADDPTGFVPAP